MIIEKLMDTHNLTESERQIKKFILDQNNDISAMTSIELGKRSYTSQASVMSFLKYKISLHKILVNILQALKMYKQHFIRFMIYL